MKHRYIPFYLLFPFAFFLVSNSTNPPDGQTSAPGEDTCTSCHGGNNANGFEGSLEVQGLPEEITPNTTYTISVLAKRTSGTPTRAGFQLVALDGENNNIGSLANPSASATIKNSDGRDYFEHNPALKFETQDQVNWTVDWTAPTTVDANVTFYAAAILGNGSGSGGDAHLSTSVSGIVQSSIADAPTIIANITAENVSCFGGNDGAATIEVSGGTAPYTYKWSNDREEATITDFSVGNYSVIISDANGVTSEAAIKIDEPALLMVEVASTTNIDCNNDVGSAMLEVTGGTQPYMYTWAGMQGFPPSLPVGDHEITVTDSNNCSETTIITIEKTVVLPQVNAGPSKHIDCQSATATLEGSGEEGDDITYLWTTIDGRILGGETTLTPVVDLKGIYTLLVTNRSTDCKASSQVQVTENFEEPIADAGPTKQLSCAADDIRLDGTNSSTGDIFTYLWTSNDGSIRNPTTPTPSVSQIGLYTLTVLNSFNGCSSASTVNVIQDINMPTAVAGEDQELDCATSRLTLNGTGSTTGIDYIYLWETEGGIIEGGETTLSPVVIASGTYTLTVRNRTNGCDASSSVVISEGTPVIANAGPDVDLSCAAGSIITLNGSTSSKGPNIVYDWSTEDGSILSVNTASLASIDAPGIYTLTVKDTVTGCVSSDETIVTQTDKAPEVTISEPMLLSCETPTIILQGIVEDTENLLFQWNTEDGNILEEKRNLTTTINAPGLYNLGVINSLTGCVTIASVTVTASADMPIARIAPITEDLDCTNSTIQLNGTNSIVENGFIIEWTTETGNIMEGATTLSPTINAAGTYTLTITNTSNGGCPSTASIDITQTAMPPTIDFEEPAQLDCINESIRLTTKEVDTNLSYEWTTLNGRIVEGHNTATPLVDAPGEYTLLLKSGDNNCESSGTVKVVQNETGIAVNITTSESLNCNTTSTTLNTNVVGGEQVTYLWCTEIGNIISGVDGPNPVIDMPGIYDVVVTDGVTECVGRDTIIIERTSSLVIDVDTVIGNSATVLVSGGMIPYEYKWSTSPVQTSVTANNLEEGIYTVTITDATGCSIEKNIGVGVSTSTKELTSLASFEAYPNPVSDFLTIQATFNWKEKGQVSIRNSVGTSVWEQAFDAQEVQLFLETANWETGIYFLVLQTKEGIKTEKIAIK